MTGAALGPCGGDSNRYVEGRGFGRREGRRNRLGGGRGGGCRAGMGGGNDPSNPICEQDFLTQRKESLQSQLDEITQRLNALAARESKGE